jgi:hypothetical protein
VGDIGAERFLKAYYGDTSINLTYYLQRMQDLLAYQRLMEKGIARLDSAYKQMDIDSTPQEQRLTAKNLLIGDLRTAIDTASFHYPKRFKKLAADTTALNNAFFLGFRMYRAQLDSMKQVLQRQYNGDVKSYLEEIKRTVD